MDKFLLFKDAVVSSDDESIDESVVEYDSDFERANKEEEEKRCILIGERALMRLIREKKFGSSSTGIQVASSHKEVMLIIQSKRKAEAILDEQPAKKSNIDIN